MSSLESHSIMDGKVHVYRRENSRKWQCSVYLSGRNHRASTKQENLAIAIEFARDWYMERYADERLRRRGEDRPSADHLARDPAKPDREPKPAVAKKQKANVKTFRDLSDAFVSEYTVLTQGERNERYVASKGEVLRNHILPFMGDRPITEITSGLIQAYRVHRLEQPAEQPENGSAHRPGRGNSQKPRAWRRPSRQTLHKEIVCIRQVLKTAARHGWLDALPDLSAPYKASGKISHRGWFSPTEYKQFYEATRERARNPKVERWRHECEQLHDYVLFMVNTGLRPDEGKRLQHRDVTIVTDEATGERILEIEVRGKRGVGYCKSMPGAVLPYQRVRKRNDAKPTDLVFGEIQRELFNAVLGELDLKKDRDGNSRTAYSLRHTYICLRLMEGADIYQVAKNCRTSVEMIETYYAVHLKDTLDAAAINVRKNPKPGVRPAARVGARRSASSER